MSNAGATHLVGGYLTYECLGNNLYQVKLRVYRDCNPNTLAFSPQARIIITDQNYGWLQDLMIAKGPTIPVGLDSNSCIVVPPGVCVEYADYIDTVSLPARPGGYHLYYKSCCRNGLIVNIPRPLNTNYAYHTTIPSMDTTCNNSPQLLGVSPILLCHNEPIDLTLDAEDPDGDSLHFELCDILGYNNSNPVPHFPIAFTPPYSSQFPMPATPPFAVNPESGQITGTPTQIGHYVLGICVSDYRNGQLLSTVRLDYQFNVTTCKVVTADILTQAEDSSLYCTGLDMNFINQSIASSSYRWDFGDTTTNADTSRQKDARYHYPVPGNYTVTLIADPGTNCSDTTTAVFEVREKVVPSFLGEGVYCFDEQPVRLTPDGSYPPGSSFKWSFGPDAMVMAGVDTPLVSWPAGGSYPVKLSVRFGKCTWDAVDTVLIRDELLSDILTADEDSGLTCNGLTLNFTSQARGGTSVEWDFGDPSTVADTSTQPNPSYTYPAPGEYDVRLKVMQGNACSAEKVFPIEVQKKLEPKIDMQGRFCFESQDITLQAIGSYPPDTEFRWQCGDEAEVSGNRGTNIKVRYKHPGTYAVKLTSTRGYCTDTLYDTLVVTAFTVPVDAGDTQVVDQSRFVRLQSSPAYQIYWFANQPVEISSPFSQATSAQLQPGTDTIIFYVKAISSEGCEGLDSVYVFVEGEEPQLSNYISPNGDGRNDYLDLGPAMPGTDCRFTILNRWGSEIFHGEEGVKRWDGINDEGQEVGDATYYYIVYCHPLVVAKGPVTIIRGNMR